MPYRSQSCFKAFLRALPFALLILGAAFASAGAFQIQSITFDSIPAQTYGNGPVTLKAKASSG